VEKMARKEKTEKDILIEMNKKLDRLIGILATQGKDRDDKIRILVSLGFSNSEISRLIGVPKGTVDSIRAKTQKR
jgi:hypothetical protein